MTSQRILVSGSSGPIGAALLHLATTRGYDVTRLVRTAAAGASQITWDPFKPLAPELVSGFDAVVHLAGETIVGRWTEKKKSRILQSRAVGTRNLSEALARAPQPPRVFISSSAVGYYGNRDHEVLQESSSPGQGFLPEVCRAWEAATKPAEDAGIRTAHIRTGLVLAASGGALPQMLTPFRFGIGGRVGDGRQWWSWIDIHDHVEAIHHILKTDVLRGPVNLVAPNPVTNAEFTKILASVLSRPAIFPVPAFVARLAFGQMGDELLLASQRVEPTKLIASGFSFQYTDLRASLEELLSK